MHGWTRLLALVLAIRVQSAEGMVLDALKVQSEVSKYYGDTLSSSGDLKTNACCTGAALPKHIKAALSKVHPEVVSRYYGCGLCVPDELDGLNVLDLGSGAGRDCYLLSQLVGESGSVVGIDMTKEQIEVAREHVAWHAEKFGYAKGNTHFVDGKIEDLAACDLADESFDLIVSNCVINLSTDKRAVLREAHRVLRAGGELYFSDVYASRRVPAALVSDPVLYGECLSGALYWNDFLTWPRNAALPTRGWWRTRRLRSTTRSWRRRWARSNSSPPPTASSSSSLRNSSSPIARTMVRPSYTREPSIGTRMVGRWTITISWRLARSFPCAATRTTCSTTRAFAPTLTFSATRALTLASSTAAASRCHSLPPTQAAAKAAAAGARAAEM